MTCTPPALVQSIPMAFESTNLQLTKLVFGTFSTLRSHPRNVQLMNEHLRNEDSRNAHLVNEQSLKDITEKAE